MKKALRAIKNQIGKLSFILEHKHRRKLPRLFICILLTSSFELLGVTAILPFVYAMMDMQGFMSNKYAAKVLSSFGLVDETEILAFFGVGIIILYIVKNIVLLLSNTYQTIFSARVQKELQVKMLKSYLSRPYQFFLNTTVGELHRGCSGDIVAVYSTISTMFSLTMSILTTILIGIYMIISDPFISLGTMSVAFICVIIMTKVFKPTMTRLGSKIMIANTKQGNAFNQSVYGIKELMVMGRQNLFVDTYEEAAEDLRKITVKNSFVSGLPNRTIEAFFVSGFIGVVLIRIKLGGDPASYVPTLAAFAVGAFKVLPYISSITNKINQLVYNEPQIENVYNNIKEAEAYQKKKEEYNLMHPEAGDVAADDVTVHFNDKVEIKDIYWQYEKANTPVLTNANITLKKGEAIGLIGPSGSGKTTIADIFLGLLQPQKGGVFMDDRDVFAMPKTWARIVGYVPQSVFLLAGSVRENVAFGMKDFSDGDIWKALEQAQLADFVKSLPDGLDTEVGERGVKLSGGQRQRIAIARALANRPEILVLDEATSALDNETETAIMESIDALQGQITMIIVAHRLTTIKNCNRIYRIGDGIAVEVSHDEVFG